MAELRLVVTEGLLEEPVARKLLVSLGLPDRDVRFVAKRGRTDFWKDAPRYNRAAEHVGPVLGLADLESYPCPSGLIARHLPGGRNPLFVLRVAERMIESWLLADARNLSEFLRVSCSCFPRDPDAEQHPKQTLVNIARSSRSRVIRDDMVPDAGSAGSVGCGYTPRMTEFVEQHWQPFEGAKRSESLRRAIAATKEAVSGIGVGDAKP